MVHGALAAHDADRFFPAGSFWYCGLDCLCPRRGVLVPRILPKDLPHPWALSMFKVTFGARQASRRLEETQPPTACAVQTGELATTNIPHQRPWQFLLLGWSCFAAA